MITQDKAQELGVEVIDSSSVLSDDKQNVIEQIKELVPNVVNSDGVIDKKALQDIFDISNTTSNNQGYELTFAGKGLARAKADEPTTKELKIEAEQSKDFDNTENVIIRGDNIDTLKLLYKNYHNKIKMIYIDPPYNTKNENFVYNDNFKETEANLIKDFGLNDDSVNYLSNVYGTRSHSGWLSFMYPRLKLARELLTDDGVIFISIDDNEQANLKIMCDEIFGEDNLLEQFNIQVRYTDKSLNEKDDFQKVMEYCFVYAKNKNAFKPNKPFDNYDINKFEYEIIEKTSGKEIELGNKKVIIFKDGEYDVIKHKKGNIDLLKGTWASGSVLKGNTSGKFFSNYLEERKDVDGLRTLYKVSDIGEDGLGYRYFTGPKKSTATKGLFYSGVPLDRRKDLETDDGNSKKYKSIVNFYDYSGDFGNIRHEGGVEFRGGKKPVKMLEKLISISNAKDNDIVLDFFAGSGSTAHSVMKLNSVDGFNRKFILCQWDEAINPEKNADSKNMFDFCKENNLEPVISSLTIERVNRAGEQLKAELEANKDMLSKGFDLDIGYKVFSLTDKPTIDYKNNQFDLLHKRDSYLNSLYNMLIATCKPLSTKIEELKAETIYKADNEIYVLGNITLEELEQFKDLKVNIDAFADIDLESFLNLDISNKDNIRLIY